MRIWSSALAISLAACPGVANALPCALSEADYQSMAHAKAGPLTPAAIEALSPGDNNGVILAATAGAVNVKLGEAQNPGAGATPEPVHLRAVVGLVWRTVVMWMVFLALLSLARLLG